MNLGSSARLIRRRVIVTAAAVTIAGLLISASQAASAQTSTAHREQPGPRPTIVLEHGAWADADPSALRAASVPMVPAVGVRRAPVVEGDAAMPLGTLPPSGSMHRWFPAVVTGVSD